MDPCYFEIQLDIFLFNTKYNLILAAFFDFCFVFVCMCLLS